MLYFTSAQGRSIYFLARTMLPGSRCIDALWPMNLTQRVDASPLLPSPEPQEHEEQPRTPRNQAAVDDQLLSGEAFGSGTPFGTPFGTPALMAWMENHPSAAKRALDSPLLFGSPSQLLHQVAQPPPPPQQLPLPQQQQPQLLIDPLQLPIQQLPVVVRGVDDVLQFYQSGTHPSILDAGDAPEPLMLRTASVAQPRANLYTYSVDFHRAKLLLAANYCMSDQFDNGTLFKLLGSSAEDLHKPFMRSLVRQTLDGFNVLLPFEDPGQPMADL